MRRLFVLLLILAWSSPAQGQFLSPFDFEFDPVPYDVRSSYGPDSVQYGDLRLPEGEGPFPVLVMLHGGCWQGMHRPRHVEPLVAAITEMGWATWNLSHRQATDPGGAWTGTFEDVGNGIDHLRTLAEEHTLDLGRVVSMGHSAGAHLALWAGARHKLTDLEWIPGDPLPLAGAVSLGGIADLRKNFLQEDNPCGDGVVQVMSGTPDEAADRYALASPAELLPIGVPQLLLHGRHDYVVPWQQVTAYAEEGARAGDRVEMAIFEDASHFEVIAPMAQVWLDEIRPRLMDFLISLDSVSDE